MNSGLKPAPSSSSAAMRPRVTTRPVVGCRIPLTICSSVLLPQPLGPTRLERLALLHLEADVPQRPEIGVPRAGCPAAFRAAGRTGGGTNDTAWKRSEREPSLILSLRRQAAALYSQCLQRVLPFCSAPGFTVGVSIAAGLVLLRRLESRFDPLRRIPVRVRLRRRHP